MLADGIDVEFVSNEIGYGLLARRPFERNETIWREQGYELGRLRTWSGIQKFPETARKIFCRWMDQVDLDSFRSLAEFEWVKQADWRYVQPRDPSMFMNHSCDPNTWFAAKSIEHMVARREIASGEWIVFDYVMTDCKFNPWECHCGSVQCRKEIRQDDWSCRELRRAYSGHVAPHIQYLMDYYKR